MKTIICKPLIWKMSERFTEEGLLVTQQLVLVGRDYESLEEGDLVTDGEIFKNYYNDIDNPKSWRKVYALQFRIPLDVVKETLENKKYKSLEFEIDLCENVKYQDVESAEFIRNKYTQRYIKILKIL